VSAAEPRSECNPGDVAAPVVPVFGSPDHLAWLSRRLTRNLRFRDQVAAAEREALSEYQLRLRQLEREAS
jgi:hypothetical protein